MTDTGLEISEVVPHERGLPNGRLVVERAWRHRGARRAHVGHADRKYRPQTHVVRIGPTRIARP